MAESTKVIRAQFEYVENLNKVVQSTTKALEIAQARHGQDCAVLSINGVLLHLTKLNRAYMPEVIENMQEIQALCVKVLKDQLAREKSELEGARWRLKEMLK